MSKKIILTSLKAIWDYQNKKPLDDVPDAFQKLKAEKIAEVLVLSNGDKPNGFDNYFKDIVTFRKEQGRQNGSLIKTLVDKHENLKFSDFITLGVSHEDLQMAKNSKTLFVRAGWVESDPKVKPYGLALKTPLTLKLVISLLKSKEPWFYHCKISDTFEIYSLANGGNFNQPEEQVEFAKRLRTYLKEGDKKHHPAFLLHFISSLLNTSTFTDEVKWWGFYPSSDSTEDDGQMMGLISKRARFSVSQAQTAKIGEPFFVRHTNSTKRCHGASMEDRLKPDHQISTIHVNPYYKRRIKGKTIAILDDFTTYGMSLSCACALLLEAGARKVVGIAIGKFGKQLRYFDIDLQDQDVFSPMTGCNSYTQRNIDSSGSYSREAQMEYLDKFSEIFS